MQTRSLVHVPMAIKAPFRGRCDKKVIFQVAIGARNGRIYLEMRQKGAKDQEFISIEGDCEVLVELKGAQVYFSKEHDAITMKDDYTSFYGGLTYGDYDPEADRYRSVSFYARFNKTGKCDTSHPFNINVDLYQRGGKPEWVPISIDPDIKNPPPWVNSKPL